MGVENAPERLLVAGFEPVKRIAIDGGDRAGHGHLQTLGRRMPVF
jgi:hypothetical protein